MKDNSVSKNNKLAGWIEDFITNFSKSESEKEVEAKKETVAEININELDKVVWNDETFYVFFDENGASIINAFGNTVTTLDSVYTIDEVNQKLNSKQIVSSIDNDLVNEIDAALSTIEADNNDDIAKQYVDEYNDNNQEQSVNDDTTETTDVTANNEDKEEEEKEITLEDTVEETSDDSLEELNNEPGTTFDSNAFETGFSELEYDPMAVNQQLKDMEERLVNEFDSKLQEMMDKMFARFNPGNVYDLGQQIQEDEIEKFTEEAIETQQQILDENNIDRTIPEGKYKTDEDVNVGVPTEEELPMETPTDEVEEVVEDSTEEIPTEDVSEELQVEESVEEPSEEILELEELDAEEDSDIDDEFEIEESDMELLDGDDAEVFKTATCPCCGDKLYKTASTEEVCNVVCDNADCAVKYVIDLKDGKIFIQ